MPHGADQVIPCGDPRPWAPLWEKLPEDLRQQIAAHKAELKAYVLKRAAERGKAVSRGA